VIAAVVTAAVAVVTGGVGMVAAATRSECEVAYRVTSQWPGGFGVDLRVRNTGGGAVFPWRLRWTFAGGQRVRQGWNGNYTQTGPAVTVSSLPWNAQVAVGATVSLGFTGSSSGSNPQPTAFTLNGVTCTVAGTRRTPSTGLSSSTPAPPPAGTRPATPPRSGPAPASTTSPPSPPTDSLSPAAPAGTTPAPTSTAFPSTTGASGPTLGAGRIQYGPVYTGEGTFYGATGEGNCSYEATTDRMIAAMNQTDYQNSQACGAYVAVTGPSGASVTVKIVDRCPECKPGDIDLSAEAFAKLAAPSAGRIKISWTLLSPALSGPISFKYKDGSTTYWCAIQVRNHRNPVRSLEVQVGSAWKSLPRQDYNYFLSADGTGCGNPLRVTDIYGHQLVESGMAIKPGVVQPGTGRFGPPA
jgi:expansin (peptidoglycan-binding protein)